MLPIATEVFTITEQNPGEYVSILNDDFFKLNGVTDPNRHLKSMLLLGRHKLLREISTADRTKTVETAVHKSFRSSVFSASFHLDEDSNLIFLTYFGEKTPPSTNYIEALVHVVEVISILENDLAQGSRLPSRKL